MTERASLHLQTIESVSAQVFNLVMDIHEPKFLLVIWGPPPFLVLAFFGLGSVEGSSSTKTKGLVAFHSPSWIWWWDNSTFTCSSIDRILDNVQKCVLKKGWQILLHLLNIIMNSINPICLWKIVSWGDKRHPEGAIDSVHHCSTWSNISIHSFVNLDASNTTFQ